MKLIREPFVHFAVAGALLFGAYAWLNRGPTGAGGAAGTVRIGEREVAWLAESWTRQCGIGTLISQPVVAPSKCRARERGERGLRSENRWSLSSLLGFRRLRIP